MTRLEDLEEEMLQEQVTILVEVSKVKNLEVDMEIEHFSNEDRLLLFRDCLKQEDLRDITNL